VKFYLKKSDYSNKNVNNTNINSNDAEYLDSLYKSILDIIVIEPNGNPYNNEIIFDLNFLDPILSILDFNYFWTISHFTRDNNYLNGRKENRLKVSNEDLLIGENNFEIVVIDPNYKISNYFTRYTKIYSYFKNIAPYGGGCTVSPTSGISLKNRFKFEFLGWRSNTTSLVYNIKYLNSNKIFYDLTNEGILDKSYESIYFPFGDRFFVEVTDSSGYFTLYPCGVSILKNENIGSLDKLLDKEPQTDMKFLLIEIFNSNKNSNFVEKSVSETLADAQNAEINIDLIENYVKNSKSNLNQKNTQNLINQFLDISKNEIQKSKMDIFGGLIGDIIQNIDEEADISKMNDFYRVFNNIFKNRNNKNSTDNFIEKMQNLNSKLYENIINGQGILIQNEKFSTQMNKVSFLAIDNINVLYQDRKKKDFKQKSRYLENSNNKNSKIYQAIAMRILQNSIFNEECSEYSALCFSNKNITNIFNLTNTNGIGLQSQVNSLDFDINLPQKQFSNSIKYDLYDANILSNRGNNKNSKYSLRNKRILFLDNFELKFDIRLKLPPIENKEILYNSTCVQYGSDKFPNTSCETWFDIKTREVICSCSSQGLIVNILDKTLSNFSVLKQFPPVNIGIRNI